MCDVCALERERASCTVEAATFVRLSGDACTHTHEGQLLELSMGLNGISNLYFSYITEVNSLYVLTRQLTVQALFSFN